jgi:CRISPR/Cas system-associated exonuclease Cas4 (RecB family)
MDAYYANDELHEAGHYWRRFQSGNSELKLDPQAVELGAHLISDEKSVSVIGAQRSVSQVKVAGKLLREKLQHQETELTNVAVVLNDEQLLLPLLSSLPAEIDGVNITMGYGLKYAQCVVFVETIFQLYSRMSESGNRFYHEDVAELENDPFFKLVQRAETSEKPKRVYFSFDELQLSSLHEKIFHTGWRTVNGFLEELHALVSMLGERLPETSIEREFLVLIDKLVQRLADLTSKFGSVDSIKTLHTFWRQLIRTQQLDFVGEPLSGLQVMGMLETRNLDFEEVIMLGVNEGKLPSTAHNPSYFTFDIRRAYGLPCQNERDAVTAYHFYRLLQRAKKVTLVYDEDTDAFGGGEVSRYVKQLLLESGDNIKLKQLSVHQDIPNSVLPPAISFDKSADIIQKLKERAASGISPSALNTFRSCSLKYYFRYVARVKEPDLFQENIDAAKLGTAIHDTLEELYTPFVGRTLTESELKEQKKFVSEKLVAKFKEQLKTTEDLSGEDLLAFEVAKVYIERVIQYDLERIKAGEVITILGLEKKLSREVPVQINGGEISVNLKGDADRIDRLTDGTVRVIDYKTGSFRKKLNIQAKEDFERSDADNAFQMLTYLFAAAPDLPNDKIKAAGFYLRAKQIEKPVSVSIDKQPLVENELLDFYEDSLAELIQELFDDTVPFYQTDDVKRCEYCEFKDVCQR